MSPCRDAQVLATNTCEVHLPGHLCSPGISISRPARVEAECTALDSVAEDEARACRGHLVFATVHAVDLVVRARDGAHACFHSTLEWREINFGGEGDPNSALCVVRFVSCELAMKISVLAMIPLD